MDLDTNINKTVNNTFNGWFTSNCLLTMDQLKDLNKKITFEENYSLGEKSSISSDKQRNYSLKEFDLDNYERIRIVGKGGFGTAVLYRKKLEGRLVVLKEINLNELNAKERNHAINEVKVLSILNHPNIISYYNSFQSNDNLYIEMEYADAGTLSNFLSQLKSPLKEHEILHIFKQIIVAINYLHGMNILHRDIKTENIFINKDGYLKIGDFGISKLLTRTVATSLVGTPHYISPEIFEGKTYNKKSDIWALGCVLHEMACLQKTFEGTNLPVIINKIVKGQFTPIKNYSNSFRHLIKEMLQKDPDLRPSTNQVLEEVTKLINKLQLQLQRIWMQHQQEVPSIFSTAIPFVLKTEFNSLVKIARSIVYEVKLNNLHLSLEKIPLPSHKRFKELSKSSNHFLALSYDGSVYSWGCCENGQLGLGESVRGDITKPTLIQSFKSKSITRICAGEGFSVFLIKNGLVLTCGDGATACLGRSDRSSCFEPKFVDSLLSVDVTNISCGPKHVSVVTGDSKAYSWGCNVDGRLGVGEESSCCDVPTQVKFPSDVKIENVFCGPDATAFIDSKGNVWVCGRNDHNKLGLNHKQQFQMNKILYTAIPIKLSWIKHRVQSVILGKNHSAFLVENRKIITIGNNCDGQLGIGHARNYVGHHYIKHLNESKIIKTQVGSCFTIASNYDNIVYFWGARIFSKNLQLNKKISNDEGINDCDNEELNQTDEVVKIGRCNSSLMNTIETYGPDYPIIQIQDPKVVIKCINQLSIIRSQDKFIQKDVILEPQAIVSLYASSVHLHQGEIIGLANVFCFNDDTIYIVIDTTIPHPANALNESANSLNASANSNNLKTIRQATQLTNRSCLEQSISSHETIEDWIKQEFEQTDDNNLFNLNKNQETIIKNEQTEQLIERLKDENQEKDRQLRMLQEQIDHLKKDKFTFNKFFCCS